MVSLAISLLVLLLAAPAAQARSWLRPVDGTLLRAFALGSDPYARGQHRGVDLAAAVGSVARSACKGRVTFAGRVPGGGRTVSVRCGELVATYQQLATIGVRAGGRIGAGARVGTVGPSGDPRTPRAHLHLGAREAATGRYVDPLTLLREGLPVGPLPAPRAPRVAPPGPGRIPAAPPSVLARPAPVRAPVPSLPRSAPAPRAPAPRPAIPWPAWAGLASIALALPVGGLVTVRRRRARAPARTAVATR